MHGDNEIVHCMCVHGWNGKNGVSAGVIFTKIRTNFVCCPHDLNVNNVYGCLVACNFTHPDLFPVMCDFQGRHVVLIYYSKSLESPIT